MFRDGGNNDKNTPELNQDGDKGRIEVSNTLQRIKASAGVLITLFSSCGGVYKHEIDNKNFVVEKADNNTVSIDDRDENLHMDVFASQLNIQEGNNRYEVRLDGEKINVISLDDSLSSNKEISGEEINVHVADLCEIFYDALGDAVSEISQKRDFENDWNLNEDSETVVSGGNGDDNDISNGFDITIDGVEYKVEFDDEDDDTQKDAKKDEDKIGFDD